MRLLIDSSGEELVVGLGGAEGVVAEAREPALGRGRDILAVAGRVLGVLRPRDLGGIVVGTGPGSFIGTRTAISFANGYAAASGLAVRGVNSLAAIGAVHGGPDCVVLRDARRGQLYCYFPAPAGTVLLGVPELLERLSASGFRRAVLDRPRLGKLNVPALMDQLAEIGVTLALADGVPAEGLRRLAAYAEGEPYVEPVYLRDFT